MTLRKKTNYSNAPKCSDDEKLKILIFNKVRKIPQDKLAEMFEVSPDTIKKYIRQIRDNYTEEELEELNKKMKGIDEQLLLTQHKSIGVARNTLIEKGENKLLRELELGNLSGHQLSKVLVDTQRRVLIEKELGADKENKLKNFNVENLQNKLSRLISITAPGSAGDTRGARTKKDRAEDGDVDPD